MRTRNNLNPKSPCLGSASTEPDPPEKKLDVIRVRKVIGLRLESHHTMDDGRIPDDQSGENLDKLE
jgi:hypothetical protein